VLETRTRADATTPYVGWILACALAATISVAQRTLADPVEQQLTLGGTRKSIFLRDLTPGADAGYAVAWSP
jgi:hypothetical protein